MGNAAPQLKETTGPSLQLVRNTSPQHHHDTHLHPPAEFKKRAFALFLDGIFSGVISNVITKVVMSLLTANSGGAAEAKLPLSAAVLALGIWFFYNCVPVYLSGQTLGKKLMKIRVVTKDNNPDVGMFKILIRETFGKFVSGIVFGYGYLAMRFNSERRTWHDRMTGTKVVSLS